jgi:hypothetical protein
MHALSCWDLFNYIRYCGNTIRIAVSFHLLGVDSAFGICCRCVCLKDRITLAHKKQISVTVSREQCIRLHKTHMDAIIILPLARFFLSR